jgi:hypothetical protein
VFRKLKLLIMVVIALMLASGVFAVVATTANYQALAEAVATSPSVSPKPTPSGESTPTPTVAPTETANPTPTPTPTSTPTIDPAAALLDIATYRQRAIDKHRRVVKVRSELVKRTHALGIKSPKRLKPRSSFVTWEARFNYYKNLLTKYRERNKECWRRIYTIHNKGGTTGVNRWIPLLRYCGMPEGQMWRAIKVMTGESHGDPTACNSSNHRGLYQFSVDWWYGKWNPFNPYQNVLHFVRAIKVPGGWSHWAATA